MRTFITVAAILAASAAATCVHAQDTAKPAAAPKAAQPASGKAVSDPAAQAILKQAFDAMKVTKFWKYNAVVEGPQSGAAGEYKAEVILERADAGGWKALVDADVKLSKSETAKPKKIVVAYDGASARSIRDTDKQVGELSDPADLGEVMAFFAKERAATPIVWELLADKPLDEKGLIVKAETSVEVDSVLCDVLLVEFKGEKAKDLDPVDAAGGRYFIGQKDHMLRKVERLRPNAKAGDKPVKTVTLTGIEFAEQPRGANFAVQVPKGYTVKPEARKAKPKPIEKAKEVVKAKPTGNGLLEDGAVAPAFDLKDDKGAKVSLAGLKGKIVVLDFWATWCGPCKMAMPALQKLHEKYKDVTFLGMHTDSRTDDKAPGVMKDLGCNYTLVLGAGAIQAQYKVSGIPALYIIGADGKVAFSHVGFTPTLEKDFSEKLDAMLKK
ncbi:MAG: TlpA disulfide reductase family protein [Planctomycetota bacterium]